MGQIKHQPHSVSEGSALEQDLILRILAGEKRYFHDLVRPYERQIYLAALAIVRCEQDAEDAAQEGVLKAYLHLHQFRFEAKFGTWLTSIVMNEARSRLRRNQSKKTEALDADPEQQSFSPAVLADWREVPSASLERMEVRQMLQDAVSDLPDIYREVFLARDVEGLNINEATIALGISEASVKVRLHRARMLLQRRLVPLLKSGKERSARFRWF